MQRKILALVIAILGFEILFFVPDWQHLHWSLGTYGSAWFLGFIITAQAALMTAFLPKALSTFAAKKSSHSVLPLRLKVAFGFSALSVVTAALAVWHGSSVDTFLLGSMSMIGTALSIYFYALTHDYFGSVFEMIMAPLQVGLSWLGSFFKVLFEYPTLLLKKVSRSSWSQKLSWRPAEEHQIAIFRGLIVTIPIVILLLGLLAGADPIFGRMLDNLFHWKITLPPFLNVLLMRTVIGLCVSMVVLPLLVLTIPHRFHSPLAQQNWKNLRIEAMMALAAVCAILGVFLIVQFRYLFATVSETELHQFGVQTFSEYVRKGFSELLLVGMLVYGVASFGLLVVRQLHPTAKKWLNGLNTLLIVEGLIFLFSVARRVYLYQASHGLSRSRVYGLAFLAVLAVLFISLLLRVYVQKKLQWYLLEIALVAGVLLFTVSIEPDKLIATNFPPTVNDEVDYVYIARLSPAAAEGWVQAFNYAKGILLNPIYTDKYDYSAEEVRQIRYANQIVYALNNDVANLKWYHDIKGRADGWKYFNAAQEKAIVVLQDKISPDDLDAMNKRAYTLNDIFYKKNYNVTLDRSYRSPLVD